MLPVRIYHLKCYQFKYKLISLVTTYLNDAPNWRALIRFRVRVDTLIWQKSSWNWCSDIWHPYATSQCLLIALILMVALIWVYNALMFIIKFPIWITYGKYLNTIFLWFQRINDVAFMIDVMRLCIYFIIKTNLTNSVRVISTLKCVCANWMFSYFLIV